MSNPVLVGLGQPELCEVQAVLERAIDRLEGIGWTQHKFWSLGDNGAPKGFCALGAIGGYLLWSERPSFDYAERVAGSLLAGMVYNLMVSDPLGDYDNWYEWAVKAIGHWNDSSLTRKADVIAKLNEAIQIVKDEIVLRLVDSAPCSVEFNDVIEIKENEYA